MGDKKNAVRFTVQFNRTDPAHVEAANILNQYERFGKARYLVNAILHYEKCGERGARQSAKIDEKHIEAVVGRILREIHTGGAGAPLGFGNGKRVNNAQPYSEISFDDAIDALGKEGLGAIADALDMFRKK